MHDFQVFLDAFKFIGRNGQIPGAPRISRRSCT